MSRTTSTHSTTPASTIPSHSTTTLEPTRRRFGVLGALAILSLICLLPILVLYARSYFATDNWKKNTTVSHTQYRSGEGGMEYIQVTWPDQVSQVELTNGWEHESFDAVSTWLAKPLGSREWKFNFAGIQYNEAKPSRGAGGGGGGGLAVGAAVTAPFVRFRMPYWPLLIPFSVIPLIWLVVYSIRKNRA